MTWQPKEDEIFFTEKDGMIIASYLTKDFGVPEDRQLLQYIIAKKHYKERIPDLLQHINYFVLIMTMSMSIWYLLSQSRTILTVIPI